MKLTPDNSLWIPSGDTFRWWSDSYEKRQFDIVSRCLIGRRVALDIGAHVGLWSKRLASLFEDVVAFEPVPSHIKCFQRNCDDISNIILHPVALSNERGQQVMKVISAGNTGMSALNKRFYGVKSDDIVVQVDVLDDYSLVDVDFIKMDVEGNELRALQGAMNLIQRCHPLIFVEDHYHTSKKKNGLSSIDYLLSIGYKDLGLPNGHRFDDGENNYLMSYEGWN